MKIAVCDDTRRDAEELRNILVRLSESNAIDVYETGRAFLAATSEREYDMVFMDVYLQGENGVEVIREMRNHQPETVVVFTTVSDSHAVAAYSVRAVHYLVKPYTEPDVAEALERAKKLRMSDLPTSMLTVRIGTDVFTMNQRDIIRMEASDHKTNIFMKEGSLHSIWMSFGKVVEQLDKSFLTINRGICINMCHVVRWCANDCEMSDSTLYRLNRRRRQELKEAYFSFKMDEMEALKPE